MFTTFLLRRSFATAFLLAGLAKSYTQETLPTDVTGRWQVTRALKNGGQEVSTLDFTQSGPDVSGTFTSPDGEAITIQGGKLVDASLTFSFFYENRHLDVSGQILSDNKMDLTITSQGMSETFHAIAERRETSSASRREAFCLCPSDFWPTGADSPCVWSRSLDAEPAQSLST